MTQTVYRFNFTSNTIPEDQAIAQLHALAQPKPKPRGRASLTILIPAYNEAASIADTIRSLRFQTAPIEEVIVIDDCSTDNTGQIARDLGVTVLRTPKNTGCKSNALNFGLEKVKSEFTMAIDADTVLAPDAVEKLMPAFDDPQVGGACGSVLPRHVNTIWERGRYIEYLFAFGFFKTIQDYYDHPLIASGCFSAYRTSVLREHQGWSTRTVGEDMDLTWRLYKSGQRVRYVPTAVSYPIEPHNYHFMRKQLARWSHGFVQNVKLHWRDVLHNPFLRSTVAVALWDASIATAMYLLLVPLLVMFVSPLFILGYLIDLPAVLVPVMYHAWYRKEVKLAFKSIPGFMVLRMINGVFMLQAVWDEFFARKTMHKFEKGH